MSTDPIIVTDTDDLAKMFGAHLIGFTGGRIGYDAANRFGQSLIEIMRANCPPDVGLPAIRREVALEIGGRIDEVFRRVQDMPLGQAFAAAAFEIGGIIGDYTKTVG